MVNLYLPKRVLCGIAYELLPTYDIYHELHLPQHR
jgi:hypothetical protein